MHTKPASSIARDAGAARIATRAALPNHVKMCSTLVHWATAPLTRALPSECARMRARPLSQAPQVGNATAPEPAACAPNRAGRSRDHRRPIWGVPTRDPPLHTVVDTPHKTSHTITSARVGFAPQAGRERAPISWMHRPIPQPSEIALA